jgi:hypothetical protein
MKHLNEEELIALYYVEPAEDPDARRHLAQCEECAGSYAELKQDLEGIQAAEAPPRGVEYGEQVWQALRPSLVAYERPRRSWFGISWKAAGLATACAVLIALGFVGGRYWERRGTNLAKNAAGGANAQATQRVVLVVLTDHLDRTERLLVALQHADAGDAPELQSQARELLASNRLYRASATEAGDPALAGALDRLERVLAEVANDPDLSEADLDRVRTQMNTEGILFEIRVLQSRTADEARATVHTKGATI